MMMNVGNLPEAHAAQIRQVQGDLGVDVAVGIGPFIAEAFGIGGSAGADAVGNDDDDAIEFHVLPLPIIPADIYEPWQKRQWSWHR